MMEDRDEQELRQGLRALVADPPARLPVTGVIQAARLHRRRRRWEIGAVAVLAGVAAALPVALAGNGGPDNPSTPPPPASAPVSAPADPVIGRQYLLSIYVHCGIKYANFGGRSWQVDPVQAKPFASYQRGTVNRIYGTMTLVAADEAVFVSKAPEVTVTFRPFSGEKEGCD